MSFLIETSIGPFRYWAKITYQGERFYNFRLEGLRNNASSFPTKELAEQAIPKIRSQTALTVVKY